MMLHDIINTITTDWREVLLECLEPHENALQTIFTEHEEKYKDALDILPTADQIFNAFMHCNIKDTRVVILGQDCYPTKGHAMGLSFSVPSNIKCAASLRNIFKELHHEYNTQRDNTDLTDWAEQGVLLLNTALTVREGAAGSHLKQWKPFTWDVLTYLSTYHDNICYILWGNHAHEYARLINPDKNLIIKGIHPSPLAARAGSFVGCGHFKLANDYLTSVNKPNIKWL